jgi:hypothetical protein
MSEPLEERLSRFTPDASGLNRDALLFAAGRASVRPSRRWQALAGVLATSQLLTLVFLWSLTPASSPSETSFIGSKPSRLDSAVVPATEPDPSEWRALRQRILDTDLDYSVPSSAEPMVPQESPLRAFGTPPESILN